MTVCLSPNGPNRLEIDAPPQRLLVGTIGGVAVLERNESHGAWRVRARGLTDRHISALLRDPAGTVFAGAHNGGLFRSEDDGQTWQESGDGLTSDHVFTLGVASPDAGLVHYAGTEPASLFRSRDGGRSWTELPALKAMPGHEKWTFPPPPHIAHTKSVVVDRRDPATLLAAVEQGALLKSTDGGESWRELASYYRDDDKWYRDIHRVVPVPSDPDELFMTSGMGLYHSLDFGETWEKLTGLDARIAYPDHLVISPDDENLLLMSGAGTDPSVWRTTHLANGTVQKSTDRGRTWALADRGLPTSGRPNIEAMCLAVYPGGSTAFAGTTDGEVYASEDFGESWQAVGRGLSPVSKVGHYRHVQAVPA